MDNNIRHVDWQTTRQFTSSRAPNRAIEMKQPVQYKTGKRTDTRETAKENHMDDVRPTYLESCCLAD
jgi:hypothetical protein